MSTPVEHHLKSSPLRIVVGTILFGALIWYAAFHFPFHFPPQRRLWSGSYAFGFNNSVALLALLVLLGIVSLIARRRAISPAIAFRGTIQSSRPLWFAFVLMSILYAYVAFAMYRYQITSAPWLMWEVRHLNYRTLLMDIYDLHPYTNFSAEYGPLLVYAPLLTYRLLKLVGGSYEQGYFAAHFLLNVAGLWCIAYLLSNVKISHIPQLVIFTLAAVSGFAPYMGINGVILRYLLPFASLLIAWRTLPRINSMPNVRWRWFSILAMITLLVSANLSASAEVGLAFVIAWLNYCLFEFRATSSLLTLSLMSIILVAFMCWLLLPSAYYLTVLQFSRGANNLPLLPAPHLVFYLTTLFFIVPRLLSGISNKASRDIDSSINAAFGVLCVVMMPGALGRCDPPHVLFYGMGATVLLMIWLAQRWPRALSLYAVGYFMVFVIWMQLVNFRVFYNVYPNAFLSRRGIEDVVWKVNHSSTIEQAPALSTLDQYPRIGLPFATFGDPVVEDYIIRRGQLQPDYYISIVALYTPADVQRKLSELARMDYILVPRGFGIHSPPDPCQELLLNLQKWFLRQVNLPCRAAPLDPTGEIDSFISNHYLVVQNVGSSVLMRRAAAQ